MNLTLKSLVLIGSATAVCAQDFQLGTHGAVNDSGEISVPSTDFRSGWVMLGSWTILDGEEASGMHVVYTQPDAVAAYLETGEFPDGTVLVKELLSAKTQTLTTGTVASADEVEGWFVMIKDREGRFGGNPLWGNGWGWAQFDANDPENTFTENYEDECIACHEPAEETDWVYVEGYPILK